jgi:hypothetical protein
MKKETFQLLEPNIRCSISNSNLSNIPNIDECVYILKFDSGIVKIGRTVQLKRRMGSYLSDMRDGKGRFNKSGFVIKYVIVTHDLGQAVYLEMVLLDLNLDYRIKGEYMTDLHEDTLRHIAQATGRSKSAINAWIRDQKKEGKL